MQREENLTLINSALGYREKQQNYLCAIQYNVSREGTFSLEVDGWFIFDRYVFVLSVIHLEGPIFWELPTGSYRKVPSQPLFPYFLFSGFQILSFFSPSIFFFISKTDFVSDSLQEIQILIVVMI
ncbi:hypothetical protein CDAR_387241 [Caerostris darwini]|uniref:Uncharacterized protein n=1 Tax=Caerostris darwini TaxID=1538125 RepID=A0AAV4MY60_9ARAC|nr:hypothetical protein CDAR_387241 [Caerostris darwini]